MAETYTPTPWGLRDFGRGLIIISEVSGKPIVMDFVRKGMNGAEPRFGKRTDSMGGIMVPLSEWDSKPPDLDFILRAVNGYEALVAAVRLALSIETSVTQGQEKELRAQAKSIYESALTLAEKGSES